MFGILKDTSRAGGIEFLIVGLGNPGGKYEITRHNAGFLCADLFAESMNTEIKRLKYHALTAEVNIDGHRCLLMKPQTFMNNSGEAVAEAAKFYKIPLEKIIVVFDDISLPIGKLRVRRKGSAGGHNGIKSIISHLGSENFPRVKIGVGAKPHPDYDLADWVLASFKKEDFPALKEAMVNAGEAIKLIVNGNTDKAMNLYN